MREKYSEFAAVFSYNRLFFLQIRIFRFYQIKIESIKILYEIK